PDHPGRIRFARPDGGGANPLRPFHRDRLLDARREVTPSGSRPRRGGRSGGSGLRRPRRIGVGRLGRGRKLGTGCHSPEGAGTFAGTSAGGGSSAPEVTGPGAPDLETSAGAGGSSAGGGSDAEAALEATGTDRDGRGNATRAPGGDSGDD